MGKDCLIEVEMVDEDYLMKAGVMADGCLLGDFDHQV